MTSALDEFAAHTAEALRSIEAHAVPHAVNFTLEQQIIDDDTLVGHYHVQIRGGAVVVVPGAADSPDVTMRQDLATARALQSGELHAQGAFLTGRLSIDGDINTLLEHGSLLSRLLDATAPEA